MKHFLSHCISLIKDRIKRPERQATTEPKRHRKLAWVLGGSLAVGALVIGLSGLDVGQVMANETSGASTVVAPIGQGVGSVVAGLATLLIKLLAGLLWFVLYWMGDLMDNTFILEGEIGEKLRAVWVIVRNFVNIFFALMLVIVALMSVVGYGDDSGNYSMKKFIPKMALALIAVNFTFLACRVVLDINNVLTTAIFAIPQSVTSISDIGPSGTAGVKIYKKFKCFDSKEPVNDAIKRANDLERANPGVIAQLGGVCFAQKGQEKEDIIPLGSSQFTKKDFVWTMATQFQGLHNLNKVSQLVDPSFTGLTVNALFSIIFAAVYGTAYIAMFIILIARMAVLWITIMLSPLVAISIAVPDLLPDDLNIQKKFLDHAFVPAKMAVPLAFGYILISQMSIAINTDSAIIGNGELDLTQGGEFAHGVSITTLMYGAASVAVIWMGVFAASKDVVGSEIVGKFGDTVKSIGTTVAKWPTYIPMIPIAGGTSLQTLKGGISELQHHMRRSQTQKNTKFADEMLRSAGIVPPESRQAIRNIENMVKQGVFNSRQLGQDMSKLSEREVLAQSEKFLKVKDRAKRESIAEGMGYGRNGWDKLEKDIRAGNGGIIKTSVDNYAKVGTTAPPARTDYNTGAVRTAFQKMEAGGAAGQFVVDASTLRDSEKEKIGIDKRHTTDKSINVSGKGVNKWVEWLKSLDPGEQKKQIKKNIAYFKKMRSDEFKAFREKIQGDEDTKKVFRSLFGVNAAENNQLLEVYASLFAESNKKGEIEDDQIEALKKALEKEKVAF